MADEQERKEGITIRLPDKSVIAILLALAGFAWNKWDVVDQKDTNSKVEQVMYEQLSKDIESLKYEVRVLRRRMALREERAPAAGAVVVETRSSLGPPRDKPIRVHRSYGDLVRFAQQDEAELPPLDAATE